MTTIINGSSPSITFSDSTTQSSGISAVDGVVQITAGGTGQNTATAAFNALNPMTTTGDIIYEASPTTAARLPIGSTGQVLTVSGGIPAWATASGGVTSVSASTGISVSASTGAVTITNTSPNQLTTTTGSPAYYAARSWVNFNGSGTVSIRASVNVSSITDHGTGEYSVNYITAMPDASYSVVISGKLSTFPNNDPCLARPMRNSDSLFTGSVRLQTGPGSNPNGLEDATIVCVAVFR